MCRHAGLTPLTRYLPVLKGRIKGFTKQDVTVCVWVHTFTRTTCTQCTRMQVWIHARPSKLMSVFVETRQWHVVVKYKRKTWSPVNLWNLYLTVKHDNYIIRGYFFFKQIINWLPIFSKVLSYKYYEHNLLQDSRGTLIIQQSGTF